MAYLYNGWLFACACTVQYVHCTTGSLQKVRFPEKL